MLKRNLATLLEVWISLKLIGLKLYRLILVGQAHYYTHLTCQRLKVVCKQESATGLLKVQERQSLIT